MARVVIVTSPSVLASGKVDQAALADMLDAGLKLAAQAPSSADAWRAMLPNNASLGLKFNRSGQESLGTSSAVAETLASSLVRAGWSPASLVMMEEPRGVRQALATTAPQPGFQDIETDFGIGRDRFTKVLDQVSALINMPFLKTHNLAGVTACLKNISHGLVKRPARFHADHCGPGIAHINASALIRNRLKFCMVDALRVVFRGGPEAEPGNIHPAGAIILGCDPVAVDTVAIQFLNSIREQYGLSEIAIPKYLALASSLGVGISDLQRIDRFSLIVS